MGKYLLAYRGGGAMAATEAETQAVMQQWGVWFGSIGADLVDGGAPSGASASIGADAANGATSALTGYSLLTAESLAAATEKAKGCPLLTSGGTVDIYETIEMG